LSAQGIAAARGIAVQGLRIRRRAFLPFWLFLLVPNLSHAASSSPSLEDRVADIVAVMVLILVPILAIALIWMVHVLPETIAEKNQHPQKEAIKTLCLLSLVFGGLLWPLAWLWTFTKPVAYKMAYGTDKHTDYYREWGERLANNATVNRDEENRFCQVLDRMELMHPLPPKLEELRLAVRKRLSVPGTSLAHDMSV